MSSHGPAGFLEKLQSAACDGAKSWTDPRELVLPKGEQAAAQNQGRLHPRARHCGLRVTSFGYQGQVIGNPFIWNSL